VLVLGIENLESLGQSGIAPMQAQQAVRESMERAYPHGAAGDSEQVSMRPRICAAALW